MKRAIFLVPLLLVAGCGAVGGREQAASATALRLLDAVAAGDGAGACAVLAPDTASEVSESDCPSAILGENLPAPGTVVEADVYGQWAQVRLTGDTVFLAVFPGGWRVVAAGCAAQGDRPYDCAVSGG
ncbi:hypothetical protein ACIA5D_07750 [Actinoplanes sp. NPDC051513]|uniref:hypothetical protein n=1 Tax=Actinoplanes sp. NPDC051513 TaxID=3363908 RepID=UPI0037B4EF78